MFGAQTGKRNLFEAIAQVDDEQKKQQRKQQQRQEPASEAVAGEETRGKRRRRSVPDASPVVEGPSKQSKARARLLRKTKQGR
tara:strand:+ start:8898 stop:9146 length:249 start_codon:yes stop_codon:yes gene_type:complete